MNKTLHQYDPKDLSDYLVSHVPGFSKLKEIEKFSDGQSNPTYKATDITGTNYVLRAKPPGQLLKSAHAVDREFRVMSALANTEIPVPKMLHLSGQETPLGTQFFVMEYLVGTVFWDPALPGHSNSFRQKTFTELVTILSKLHDLSPTTVGLEDYGKAGNYFERQVKRWSTQYRASEMEHLSEMNWTIDWLNQNLVADDGQVSIVHGDYRLDNVMFERGSSKIVAVLDWELSTLGHPFADLAYQCMGLRLPQTGMIKGLDGVDRQLVDIPSEAEYVAEYCSLRGINLPDNWSFYITFSFFRLAAILQGVLHRSHSGNASNPTEIDVMKSTIITLARAAKASAKEAEK